MDTAQVTGALQGQDEASQKLTREIEKIWADDKLERIGVAKKLTNILTKAKADETGFTMVVKSPWGTGKSFFIERWCETLKKQGAFCVYFSAWEAEIQDSPAIYFLQTFFDEFKEQPELFSKLDDALAKGGLTFLSVVIALATIVYMPVNAVYACIAKYFYGEAAKKCARALNKLKRDKHAFETSLPTKEAKEHLKELMQVIAESSLNGKVYIFIDELDRCKPDFAIKVLEEIKHFFSLPNLVFVLSLDFEQLEGSVKHVYGRHIDCEGYLMRFVQLFYTLPTVNQIKYAEYLLQQLSGLPFKIPSFNDQKLSPAGYFAACAASFKSSLRDQQNIITRLKLMLTAGNILFLPTFYLLFVQQKYPSLWQQAMLEKKIAILAPNRLNQTKDRFSLSNKIPHTEWRLHEYLIPLTSGIIELMDTPPRTSERQNKCIELEKWIKPQVARDDGTSYECYSHIVRESNFHDLDRQADLINLYSEGFD